MSYHLLTIGASLSVSLAVNLAAHYYIWERERKWRESRHPDGPRL